MNGLAAVRARTLRTALGKAIATRHDVQRPPLGLHEGPTHICAEYPEGDQLHATEEQDDHQRGLKTNSVQAESTNAARVTNMPKSTMSVSGLTEKLITPLVASLSILESVYFVVPA